MRQRLFAIMAVLILISTFLYAVSNAANTLEIVFDKSSDGNGGFLYTIFLGANKDSATSCTLTTPPGIYPCLDLGDVWYPVPGFGHANLTFAELACNATSWTPPSALNSGTWLVEVQNSISDFRLVADGIGGPIFGDPWLLENEDWLALQSIAGAEWEVVPSQNRSLGAVKILYR